jgi:hypothetical protein
VLSYDTRNRTAHWVFEHLTKDVLNRNESVDRGKSDFVEDESVHPFFRSKNSDYKVILAAGGEVGLLFFKKNTFKTCLVAFQTIRSIYFSQKHSMTIAIAY